MIRYYFHYIVYSVNSVNTPELNTYANLEYLFPCDCTKLRIAKMPLCRKIKASGKWTEEQIMNYKLTMENFQEEKCTKRQQYSNGDISYKELLDWFSSQREIADQFVANL